MGFGEADARSSLAAHGWEVNAALDALLTGAFPTGADAETERSSDTGASTDIATEAVASSADAETASCSDLGGGSEAANVSIGSIPASLGDDGVPERTAASSAVVDLPVAAAESKEAQVVEASSAAPADATAQAGREEGASAQSTAQPRPLEPVAEAEAAPEPRKELMRVSSSWTEESASGQLGLQKDALVSAWVDTRADNGWIYAEDLTSVQGGWVPTTCLESAPAGHQFMRAVQGCRAGAAGELCVELGAAFQVHVESRTSLGWVHVQALPGASSRREPSSPQEGWVPDYCFEWSAQLLQ